jgi:hypothetical protein
MRRRAVLCLAFGFAPIACAGSNGGGGGPSTCQTMCGSQPECESKAGQCVSDCESLEAACEASGDPTDFQTFVACETTAHYSCTSGIATTTDCQAEFAAVMTRCL